MRVGLQSNSHLIVNQLISTHTQSISKHGQR